ncbi:ferrochelatase [Aliagarivorans marinus]|uniref:ferrochelatase n=1 Tax=Aliagarivorans marinus TaxID=561965 RepID=UPI000429AB59|nr:ferrochelatase [Aliagarivorans marinus]
MVPASDERFAVILCNLGTPESATPKGVAKFLRRFLSDKRVVDLPRALWLPLLNGVILPLRSRRVAKLYQQIWLDQGSPLAVISENLRAKLAKELDGRAEVLLAMNYSDPDIAQVLEQVVQQGFDKVLVLPMYPQYSVTTTAPVFDAYHRASQKLYRLPEVRMVSHYYQSPRYIQALANSIRQQWQTEKPGEVLLFSFHGIPERYSKLGDPYAKHCEATAEAVALELGLSQKQWRLCFQSRFGKEPWLQPYTDELLAGLVEKGVKSVDIISPAFATDCLETIEELGSELREEFMEAGGEHYNYIPALNDGADQLALYREIIEHHTQGW